jgi:2-oxo-3-hexenedioate decarboxylase
MLPPDDLAAIAVAMKAAQDGARQVEPWSEHPRGLDVESAYAVAQRVHEARCREGAHPIGRKIGFTNYAMWDHYGVRAPIWAYVYDRTVGQLAAPRATTSLAPYCEPKLEPEIVFHFGATPPPHPDVAALAASIDWLAHGFELVQSHFPGWRFTAADTIADWSLHGRLWVGAHRRLDDLGADPARALATFTVDLACDDGPCVRGGGSDVLGSPLLALQHLAALLASQPDAEPLRAGEIVTTGTLTIAQPVNAGETWRTSLHGLDLPGLAITFER